MSKRKENCVKELEKGRGAGKESSVKVPQLGCKLKSTILIHKSRESERKVGIQGPAATPPNERKREKKKTPSQQGHDFPRRINSRTGWDMNI